MAHSDLEIQVKEVHYPPGMHNLVYYIQGDTYQTNGTIKICRWCSKCDYMSNRKIIQEKHLPELWKIVNRRKS